MDTNTGNTILQASFGDTYGSGGVLVELFSF